MLLLAGSPAAGIAGGTDGAKCLQLDIHERPSDSNPRETQLEMSLFNDCGKDITAYRTVVRDSSGARKSAGAHDELAFLSFPRPKPAHLEVFLEKTTRSFPFEALPPGDSISVAAVIFSDDTTAGDPEDIAFLIAFRKSCLERMKKQLEILDSATDWQEALQLRQRANKAGASDPPPDYLLNHYLEGLAGKQEHSNASTWAAFVASERQKLTQLIALFEQSLLKTAAAATEARETPPDSGPSQIH